MPLLLLLSMALRRHADDITPCRCCRCQRHADAAAIQLMPCLRAYLFRHAAADCRHAFSPMLRAMLFFASMMPRCRLAADAMMIYTLPT